MPTPLEQALDHFVACRAALIDGKAKRLSTGHLLADMMNAAERVRECGGDIRTLGLTPVKA